MRNFTIAEDGSRAIVLEVIKERARARVLTSGKVLVRARVPPIRRNDDQSKTPG